MVTIIFFQQDCEFSEVQRFAKCSPEHLKLAVIEQLYFFQPQNVPKQQMGTHLTLNHVEFI